MGTYLLDTNAISDLMYNHPLVAVRVAALRSPADAVITCTMVVGEILFGIEQLPLGKRRNDVQRRADGVLPGILCAGVERAAAPHYARLRHAAKLGGVGINENDLWIAATAAAIGAIVVTRDADFRRLPSVAVEDWTQPPPAAAQAPP
jgi:predicted nucleic acid-binding protein